MKLRISAERALERRGDAAQSDRSLSRLQLRSDAQEVHLRQRAENVLHWSVVNVEHHLLQIALGRLKQTVRRRPVRRVGAGAAARFDVVRECRRAARPLNAFLRSFRATRSRPPSPAHQYAVSVSSLNGIARYAILPSGVRTKATRVS